MFRRELLRLIGLAPLAAPLAAKALAGQFEAGELIAGQSEAGELIAGQAGKWVHAKAALNYQINAPTLQPITIGPQYKPAIDAIVKELEEQTREFVETPMFDPWEDMPGFGRSYA